MDLSSTVTLEALSLGLPVICLNHCGFKDIVTHNCGIRIEVSYPQKVIRAIAKGIEKLYFDEQLRQNLSKGALKRSEEYSWKNKMRILNKIYIEVIERSKMNIYSIDHPGSKSPSSDI